MNQPASPAEISAAYAPSRLQIIAQILYDKRHWVIAQAVPGESACGIGYRSWDLSRVEIIDAQLTYDWLVVTDSGAMFRFNIDGMPARFLRNDADEPIPAKYAIPSPTEQAQLSLALGEHAGVFLDLVYRFIVAPDGRGDFNVLFVASDKTGITPYVWRIPVNKGGAEGGAEDDGGSSISPILTPKAPVVMPPLFVPSVAERATAERAETERAEEERIKREAEERRKDGPSSKGA